MGKRCPPQRFVARTRRRRIQPQRRRGAERAPLLLVLERGFEGTSNEFLGQEVGQPVVGEVEPRLACPCCRHLTLDERGGYDICPVCFWEDDGVDELDGYSGPNHMTLAQGRKAFAELGAVSARERAFVDPDGPRKYPRTTD